MGNININTSQNISLERTVASVAERILATFFDIVFMFIYILVIYQLSDVKPLRNTSIDIVALLPVLLYHLLSELFMNGQSLGKKIMKIKVVKLDGSRAGIFNYFIRWVFRLVDILMFQGAVALITIIVNGKGQRLGDMAANTTVVKMRKGDLSKTIYVDLPESYEPVFENVHKLVDNDIHTVKELLNLVKKNGYEPGLIEMADKAKFAIERKIGIRSDMKVMVFLETILHDYNYLKMN